MLSLRNNAYLFCLSVIVGTGSKDIFNKKGLVGSSIPRKREAANVVDLGMSKLCTLDI